MSILAMYNVDIHAIAPDEWVVWTYGACLGNGTENPSGGWGIFFSYNDPRNEVGYVAGPQTIQRNQLAAVLRVMQKACRRGLRKVTVFSDSKYVQFVVNDTRGIDSWARNGWIKPGKGRKDVANQDILRPLSKLMREVTLVIECVPGRRPFPQNEMADQMATYAARRYHPGVHINPHTGHPYRYHLCLHNFTCVSKLF